MNVSFWSTHRRLRQLSFHTRLSPTVIRSGSYNSMACNCQVYIHAVRLQLDGSSSCTTTAAGGVFQAQQMVGW